MILTRKGQIPLRYPGRRPGRRPGFRPAFRQVRAGLRPARDFFWYQISLSTNSTTRTRPDFVRDPCLRTGLRQSPVVSAWVSEEETDFVWS